ncbi:hypothetical protein Dimus_003576, partial [Dionaea muscipula]
INLQEAYHQEGKRVVREEPQPNDSDGSDDDNLGHGRNGASAHKSLHQSTPHAAEQVREEDEQESEKEKEKEEEEKLKVEVPEKESEAEKVDDREDAREKEVVKEVDPKDDNPYDVSRGENQVDASEKMKEANPEKMGDVEQGKIDEVDIMDEEIVPNDADKKEHAIEDEIGNEDDVVDEDEIETLDDPDAVNDEIKSSFVNEVLQEVMASTNKDNDPTSQGLEMLVYQEPVDAEYFHSAPHIHDHFEQAVRSILNGIEQQNDGFK